MPPSFRAGDAWWLPGKTGWARERAGAPAGLSAGLAAEDTGVGEEEVGVREGGHPYCCEEEKEWERWPA